MERENFDNTYVFDFSKSSRDEIKEAREFIKNCYPQLLKYVDAIEEVFSKRLTADDVFQLLSDTIPNVVGSKLSAEWWKAVCGIINRVHPGVVQSLVLRTIAIELDNNYPGHISDEGVVYVYSTTDGHIHAVDTSNINKNSWKYFAAFRSREDAVIAIKLANAVRNVFCE